jgi:2-methylcitrate dehydratase PrpD
MMAEDADHSCLTHAQSDGFRIGQIYFKPYASCRHTHAPIEAALAAKQRLGCEAGQVKSVKIRTYDGVLGKHDHQRVHGVTSAKMSIPFSVSVALCTGRAGLAEFEPVMVKNAAVCALAAKIQVQGDPEITALVPRKRVAVVTIELQDGRKWSERVDYPLGEPENPVSDENLEQKFSDLAAYGGKSVAETQAIIEAVKSRSESLKDLFALL